MTNQQAQQLSAFLMANSQKPLNITLTLNVQNVVYSPTNLQILLALANHFHSKSANSPLVQFLKKRVKKAIVTNSQNQKWQYFSA